MLWLYRFLIGFLHLEFSGDIAEIVLNICAKNGITLWGVKRKDSRLKGYITVRDFRILPKIVRKKGVRVHILKRFGLPFIIKRYEKRFGIAVGIALFFAALEIMSMFIWTIDVEGNKNTTDTEIISACRKIGIAEGVRAEKIDPKTAKQRLLLEVDSIAWASLNIEGSRLTVNVSESRAKEDEEGVPSNLVATADGTIIKIDVTSGNCLVKVGETVAKGQILVSGIIERLSGNQYVTSKGSITAVTEREIKVTAPFVKKEGIKNGKVKKQSVLSFFNIKLPLYLGSQNGTYETKLEINNTELLGKTIPITMYKKYYYMTDEKTVILNEKELKKELEELLNKRVGVEISGEFEIKNREYDEKKSEITLKAIISAEENIAEENILLFNTRN